MGEFLQLNICILLCITVALLDHSENSCFVCVILTHGEEGYVFGTDDKVQVEQMVAPFKGHKCLSLAGKPKIFLIQVGYLEPFILFSHSL